MGKPFKDKLKNVGDFISGTIAEVEKQAKDSEVLEKISKGTKDGLVFVSNGVKDGAEKITNGAKTSADTIKNVVAEHKKQGIQDNNKEKQGSLDDQLHDAVNRYNAAYAEFENNGSAILRQRERSVDLLENVENLVNSIAITCGVYGSMMHTTFCDKSHSQEVFDNMKRDLQEFIDKDTTAEEEDIFYEEFTSKY